MSSGSLDVLSSGSLDVLPSGSLDVLPSGSLDVLPSGSLDVLQRALGGRQSASGDLDGISQRTRDTFEGRFDEVM